MFMALLLGTEVPTDTLDTDGKKMVERRDDTAGAPIFDLAEIDDDPTRVDYERDADGDLIPLFVRADITAPDESDAKPTRRTDRPMMWTGLLGGCSSPEGARAELELRRVREPTTAIHYSV